MVVRIREIRENEYPLLNDFLYDAVFVPEGTPPPPKSIIDLPELQVYIRDFGQRKDDLCFLAEVKGLPVGAVWTRVMNDYGHIEDGVPSLAISVRKEYRGGGIGTALMRTILGELRKRGYEKVSLSVQKANDAVRMYHRVGFMIAEEKEEEYLMVCPLKRTLLADPIGEGSNGE